MSPTCAGTWSQAGHRVDLYAESWADDCLPPRGQRRAGGGAGPDQARADLELRRELRAGAAAQAATIARSASSTPRLTT